MEQRRKSARRSRVWDFVLFFGVGFSLAAGASLALHAAGSTDRASVSSNGSELLTDLKPDVQTDPAENAQESVSPRALSAPNAETLQAAEETFQRGHDYFKAERFGDAHREFTAAALLNPTDPRPHVGLAKVCQAMDYSLRAEQAYRKAIEIDPGFHPGRLELAKLLCDFGKNWEALELLRDESRTHQQDPLVWAEIALNEIRLGRPTRAIPLLKKYTKAHNRDDWGYVHLGRAYADAELLQQAQQAYRLGLEINPNSEKGNLWLAQLLLATDRKEQAEPRLAKFHKLRTLNTQEWELEQAVARRPENVQTHVRLLVRLSYTRQQLGKPRQALTPLKTALELAPSDVRLQKLYRNQLRRAGVRPQ